MENRLDIDKGSIENEKSNYEFQRSNVLIISVIRFHLFEKMLKYWHNEVFITKILNKIQILNTECFYRTTILTSVKII